MELVGTEVKKTFLGFGTFTGKILSYDASAGYFKIQYEDGDSEEVDHDEIASILESMGVHSPLKPDQQRRSGRGRPPKKRRRMEPDRTDAGESCGGGGGGGPEIGPAIGDNSETLATENGDSRVLEEVRVDARLEDANMEELGSENCSGRIRKRSSLSPKEKSTPEMPLRRSSRKARASATLLSHFDSVKIENVSVSEDVDLGGNYFSVRKELAMPALPPSSTDLDLDGLNVFDFFSVYTCLRSFSRLLFLSPFTLEAFMVALKCKDANLLIDSIHYSILQALKPHLEFLSEEGLETAVNCLRSLNWGILDLVTWPLFLAEYLLIHASRMKLTIKLSQLNLLDMGYYEQPAGVKLEILRCLCDDVIEVETIRLELNRRMTHYEAKIDVNCNMNVQKKRKAMSNMDPCGSLPQEVLEETDDGNSDECCLCGMDGSLICCDGCPAAFHSRCVGVVKDLLPDGDWYCPECVVEKSDKLVKLSKTFRGAEILGIDPHGRVYFGTCARLLVSSSCDSDASYHYYNKNDLSSVINILKSSYASYSAIINAISTYWGIHSVGEYGTNNHILHGDLDAQVPPSPSKQDIDGNIEKEAIGNSSSPKQYEVKRSKISNLALLNSMTSFQFGGLNCPFACSEPFDEMVHAAACLPVSELTDTDYSMNSDVPSERIISSSQASLAAGLRRLIELTGLSCTSMENDTRKGGAAHSLSDSSSYLNYYSLGRTASSIGKELVYKLSETNNNELGKSSQDIRSSQLKAISKRSNNSCWYTYDKLSTDAQKENCGWCVCCKTSSDDDCLVKVADDKSLACFIDKALAGGKSRILGLRSANNKKNHIDFAIHYILLIEDRVRGLLSGPWENPHYSDNWQEAVSKASDAASLKPLLLSLESNLRRIALSIDWSKPVDYPCAVGSGSILMSTPGRTSSNFVASRKPAKKLISGDEFSLIPHAAKSSNIYWWRGGKFSRQVFQWKILPRLLASKGARQGGCRKIPNIIYSESSEFAKMSKCVAWRAAVEMSQSVTQLIYQVQELDANIKWMELSETRIFPQSTSKKVSRSLKKVTIRRKRIEGNLVKYLLDFGKKETVPAIVTKHGVLLEEHSSGRKSYWLNETLVPLNLLKSFEERKIARSLKNSDLPHSENGRKCEMKKNDRPKGFSYLMSRVQKFESEVCGHCNKDVLVREAVNCQICSGFFHRKHFRLPKGATVTTYTCCKCKDKNSVKVKPHGLKRVLKKRKLMKGKSPQVIPEGGEHILVKNDKFAQNIPKKGKLVLVKSKKKSKLVKSNKKGKLVKIKKRIIGRKRDSQGKFIRENTEKLEEGNLKQRSLENSESNLIWKKRGKRGKSRKKKSGNLEKGNLKDGSLINFISDFSWCKRKRSVVHYSSWMNGLLWTQKLFNEQQMHFRETKILLPWQHSQDSSLKPVCCLCREEFNSRVIYIGCQNCGDWFHGDAFCLALENIKNLVGFKCNSCRMRSKPICPFSNNGIFVETQLESRCNGGMDIFGGEHQNGEEKLHSGSSKKLSPVVDSDYHPALTHSVKELFLGANHRNELDNGPYENSLIDGHILGANPRNDKRDNGPCEDGSAVANPLSDKQREDVVVHTEVVPNLYSPTVSKDGPIIQSLKHVEVNVTSTKLENKIQVGLASQEMGEDLCRMTEVPDSLPAQKLDSLEGLKT